MGKSADNDACMLNFPTSITAFKASSRITLRTAACVALRKMGVLVGRASWKQELSKETVISFLANE